MDKKYNDLYDLDVVQVRIELAKINKSRAWLARQIGISKQLLNYNFRHLRLKYVEDIARVLGIDKRSLMLPKL